MFARGKSKERGSTRKVTPPSPSYMSNEQFGIVACSRLPGRDVLIKQQLHTWQIFATPESTGPAERVPSPALDETSPRNPPV